MNEVLSVTARKTTLEPLFATGWAMVEGRDAIHKTFTFDNFVEAFGFMTRRRSGRRNGTTTRNGSMCTTGWR